VDLTALNTTIGELGIGTYDKLISARHDTPLIEILRLFISKGISSVPIVDKENVVLNVYEKYDVLLLAREGPYYNLDIPVSDALSRRPSVSHPIFFNF
jgi:predicted transcriptional regulator